jgi:topoisomerase IA-like protein
MEFESKSLGKLNGKKLYINNGKYGFYLSHDAKNYKIPDWFPHESMSLSIAERLIEYKQKISEQWMADKVKKEESSDEEEEPEPKLVIKKKNKV